MEDHVDNEAADPPALTYARDLKQYVIQSKIGSVGSATLCKAGYFPVAGMSNGNSERGMVPVAIMMVDSQRVEDLYSLTSDIHMAKNCHQENIVNVYCSFTSGQGKLWVVMPLLPQLSLRSMMVSSFPHGLLPNQQAIAFILKETLKALDCIHTNYAHKSIGADCLYIDENLSIKLAFYSLRSEAFSSQALAASPEELLHKWMMPPELDLAPTKSNWRTDIWMFGLLALELCFGNEISELPGHELNRLVGENRGSSMHRNLVGGCFVPKARKIPKELRKIIWLCLARNPMERPTAKQLMEHKFFKYCSGMKPRIRKVLQSLHNAAA